MTSTMQSCLLALVLAVVVVVPHCVDYGHAMEGLVFGDDPRRPTELSNTHICYACHATLTELLVKLPSAKPSESGAAPLRDVSVFVSFVCSLTVAVFCFTTPFPQMSMTHWMGFAIWITFVPTSSSLHRWCELARPSWTGMARTWRWLCGETPQVSRSRGVASLVKARFISAPRRSKHNAQPRQPRQRQHRRRRQRQSRRRNQRRRHRRDGKRRRSRRRRRRLQSSRSKNCNNDSVCVCVLNCS